jgi:hypothetical protein
VVAAAANADRNDTFTVRRTALLPDWAELSLRYAAPILQRLGSAE